MVENKCLLFFMASLAADISNDLPRSPPQRTGGEKIEPCFEGKPEFREGGVPPSPYPVVARLMSRHTPQLPCPGP